MRFLPAQAFNLITYMYNEPEVVNILKTMFQTTWKYQSKIA